jgi:hypothetical protein
MALRLNGSSSGYVELDVPAAAGSHTLTLPDGGGSSGQYLQTDGSGGLSWATLPEAGGTILSSGSLTGNGGSGSGVVTVASFTGLDFSAATADSRLLVMARTAIQENGNVSNTAYIDVLINVNGSSQIQVVGSRNGSPVGAQASNFILEMSANKVMSLTSTYRTTNINLLFRAQTAAVGPFYYGDQPGYTFFDGDGAGYNFSYILFGK